MTDNNDRVSNPDFNHRMKFMSKIRENMPDQSKTFLVPPKEHWLNPELFILRPQFGKNIDIAFISKNLCLVFSRISIKIN